MDYESLAEQLVSRCLEKGADQAEVFIEASRDLDVEVRNGEVETVEEAAYHGVGFRVFEKGKMAFSHCNDFSDDALSHAVARAVDYARHTTPDEDNTLPDIKGMTGVQGLHDPEIGRVPMPDKIEMARNVEKLAMRDARITKSAGAGYGEGETEIFLANSNGLLKSYKTSSCSCGVSVVAEKGEQKSSGSERCSRRFFSDLEAPEAIAEEAAKKAYEMLDPRMVNTQKAAVIFDPDVARALLGGILAGVNGERVLQGASFLSESMEKKIASDLLTIVDDGTRARGMGSKPFDGEGVPTGRRVIVEKGVLKGFMYNRVVANRAGVESTGNASRDGFTSLPGIGPHNLYIEAGESSPDDIIEATKRGLLLKSVTGYGINPVSGDFSGGAAGFWVEDGKIAFPVKGLTIAGTAEEMLNGIEMVASDLDLNRSLTAPTILIRSMQVGGE